MDLYDLLGLGRGATLIEIKRSYKRLARKYHPDINPGDHAAGSALQGDHPRVRDVEQSGASSALRHW
jgi:curved DNA-binding protein CbpA